MLAALIIVSPNLIWQYQNDFPGIHHLNELVDTQLVYLNRSDFLLGQLNYVAISFIVIPVSLISFFRYAPFKKYRHLLLDLYFYLINLSLFQRKTTLCPWTIPYFASFWCGVYGKITEEWLVKRNLRPAVVLWPVSAFLILIPITLPVYPPGWTKQNVWVKTITGGELPRYFTTKLGMSELANIVDNAFESIADKENTLILCEWYGQAGAINYYTKQNYTEAVTFHADYINWFPLDEMEIKNVIYLNHRWRYRGR